MGVGRQQQRVLIHGQQCLSVDMSVWLNRPQKTIDHARFQQQHKPPKLVRCVSLPVESLRRRRHNSPLVTNRTARHQSQRHRDTPVTDRTIKHPLGTKLLSRLNLEELRSNERSHSRQRPSTAVPRTAHPRAPGISSRSLCARPSSAASGATAGARHSRTVTMEELCARPLSPAVEVEDLTHGGTHAAACWVTNNMRSHPGDWPLKSYLSARKIKHCTGKAQAYPYAGAL